MFKKGSNSNAKSKKKIFIALGVVAVIVIVLVAFTKLFKGDDYFSITNNLLSQRKGSFRYVFDIRTDKHSDEEKKDTASSLASLENMEANMDVDKVLEEYKENKKSFVDWGNKEGIEVVDWKYPKYKVIVEGNVKSTEPLEMSLSLSLATNYFNDKLTDIVVKDNKTYVNIEQLRYWLINSKDSSLAELGNSLPESSKYVVYKGDEFNLYSTFAEQSEVNVSRESDLSVIYDRFLIFEQTLLAKLDVPSSCLDKSDDIYKLNVTGDDSLALLQSVKNTVLGVGDTYNSVITNQYNNKALTKKQYSQAKKESDNVVSAFSDLSSFLGTTDLSKLGLQVSGNARTYTGGKGSSIYESSLALQFTANDTDYSVSVQLHKDANTDDVKLPKQSTVGISKFDDKDFVEKYLIKVFEYLNVSGVDLQKQLEVTPDSMKSQMLDSFIDLVNDANADNEDFVDLTPSTVDTFIDGYRNYKITDKSSDYDVVNSTLVSDFLDEFKDFIPKEKKSEDTDEGMKDESRFPSLVADSDNFRIYADVDKDSSNIKCVQVKCYILNKSSEELVLNLGDFSLRTMQSSKYPANYESTLKEYDNSFDMDKAPQSVSIPANSYAEVPLYFVVSNGLEYMDLWCGEQNLGVLISR